MSELRKVKELVVLDLVGLNSNAYSLIASFITAAKKQDISAEEINSVVAEASSGNYDHLLQTLIANTCTL